MSHVKLVLIFCDRGQDGPNDNNCAWSHETGEDNLTDGRKNVTARGWTVEGRKDFCPHCSKVRAEAKVSK